MELLQYITRVVFLLLCAALCCVIIFITVRQLFRAYYTEKRSYLESVAGAPNVIGVPNSIEQGLDGKWYFWSNAQEEEVGPFETRELAEAAYRITKEAKFNTN